MIIRAVATIPRDTALPGDETTNTFHFQNAGAVPPTIGITGPLNDFYQFAPTGSLPVRDMMSGVNGATIRFDLYDAQALPPALPYFTVTFPFTANGSVASQAEEVAIALSIRNTTNPTVPIQRRSGRVFIGPLNTLPTSVVSGRVRVTSQWRALLLNAAERLFDQVLLNAGDPVSWGVYSKVDNAFYAASQAFVDDAFDTQRRRGPNPTIRDTRLL